VSFVSRVAKREWANAALVEEAEAALAKLAEEGG
jgi:hypothetical protein